MHKSLLLRTVRVVIQPESSGWNVPCPANCIPQVALAIQLERGSDLHLLLVGYGGKHRITSAFRTSTKQIVELGKHYLPRSW